MQTSFRIPTNHDYAPTLATDALIYGTIFGKHNRSKKIEAQDGTVPREFDPPIPDEGIV